MKTIIRTATYVDKENDIKIPFDYKIINQPENWEELEGLYGGFQESFDRCTNYLDFHVTRDIARKLGLRAIENAVNEDDLDSTNEDALRELLQELCPEVKHGLGSPTTSDFKAGEKLFAALEKNPELSARCDEQAVMVGYQSDGNWTKDACAELKQASRLYRKRQTNDPLADF